MGVGCCVRVLRARSSDSGQAAGCDRRGAGGQRGGASTRDPYPSLPWFCFCSLCILLYTRMYSLRLGYEWLLRPDTCATRPQTLPRMRVWRGTFDSYPSLACRVCAPHLLRCLTRAHTLPQGPARGFSLCYCDPPLHAGGTRTCAQPRKGRSCMCSEFLLRLLLPAASFGLCLSSSLPGDVCFQPF